MSQDWKKKKQGGIWVGGTRRQPTTFAETDT